MSLPQDKIEKISIEVIKTIVSRFQSFPIDSLGNRNAPFHEAFLRAFADKFHGKVSDVPFFISLSSWLHGLNTTLGQTFFEATAHILCDGEKKEFIPSKDSVLQVSKTQKSNIADIITELKNSSKKPDIKSENELIFCDDSDMIGGNSFTADVFIEEDDLVCAVELKSVKPNAGEMRGEKQKILEAKSALFHAYKGKRIEYYIGFPFDPTNQAEQPAGYNKERFLNSVIDGKKYFDLNEVLIADELWNFLSGDQNTMQKILDIINAIATPNFQKIYSFLNQHSNRQEYRDEYVRHLREWNLFNELELVENDDSILQRIRGKSKFTKIYNQSILKDGDYNVSRYLTLIAI